MRANPLPRRLSWVVMLLAAAAVSCQPSSQQLIEPIEDPSSKTDGAPAADVVEVDPAALLEEAARLFAEEQLEDCEQTLARIDPKQQELTEDQRRNYSAMVASVREELRDRRFWRLESSLDAAQGFLAARDLSAAEEMLNSILQATDAQPQRERALTLQQQLVERQRVRDEMRDAVKLLRSEIVEERNEARRRLWERSRDAVPTLLEAAASGEPRLVETALEMLSRMNRPETFPAILAILQRSDQSSCWPIAVAQLETSDFPQAGQELMRIAASAQGSSERIAAWEGLCRVKDPPVEAFEDLLPWLHADGPETAAAFKAAARIAWSRDLSDFMDLRGFPADLSAEASSSLRRLPDRIEALLSSDEPNKNVELVEAVRRLAIAARLRASKPLPDVRVFACNCEYPAFPASGVTDGNWKSKTGPTRWLSHESGQAWIVFDLGEEKTVTDARIWNFNGNPDEVQRGFKEVAIYVGSDPSSRAAQVRAVIPPAPHGVTSTDFSVTISLPFLRGRFVKLQCLGPWNGGNQAGLSEVQILGY
ncbi:MAG: discoidin domain-containing protein [Planctomycetales bacterium]